MKHALASALAIAAACGSTPPAPSAPHNQAAHPATIGPAPSLAWKPATDEGFGDFEVARMPAVASDGSRVLIAEDKRGGPGPIPPNMTLREIDRADHDAATQVVLPAGSGGPDDVKPTPAALAAATTFLETSNQQLGWVELPAAINSEEMNDANGDPDASRYHVASGEVDVLFNADLSQISVRDHGKVVVEKSVPEWDAPPNHNDMGGCSNPSYLEQAQIDAARRIALVTIAYKGTDSCWEPGPTLHVVAW